MTQPSVPKLDRSALLGILAQQSDDVLAELMGKVAQAAIDAQFDEYIGAEHYERSADRKDRRNGFRERTVDTRMGSIDLRIPRAREGNFVPPLVEHRKRSERALVAAVQEMFISGVSTRKLRRFLTSWVWLICQNRKSAFSARSLTPRSKPSAIAAWSRRIPT